MQLISLQNKFFALLSCSVILLATHITHAQEFSVADERQAAVNIVTYEQTGFRVDSTPQGQRVRRLLTKIRSLGINTLIFNFRARMIGGTSSDIQSEVPAKLQPEEEILLKATVDYARSLGFRIAFRPILLVVGPHGEFPYTENGFTWWHGVIRPKNPAEWFQSLFRYQSRYMKIAADIHADWFSVGAEMHSMTSGLGSRNPTQRFGHPEMWLSYVHQARTILGANVKITYGMNYTDQYVLENGVRTWGGEFEQWHHDMTYTPQTTEEKNQQKNLQDLWKAFDFVGLDYYRALGTADDIYPTDPADLVKKLSAYTIQYALDMKEILDDIHQATGTSTFLALQEVGYRSVEKCFVSPYLYEDSHTPLNYMHQAAAWDALLKSLWTPQVSWMQGIGLWQILLDDDSDQTLNGGFSPLGKTPTENVLKFHFQNKH